MKRKGCDCFNEFDVYFDEIERLMSYLPSANVDSEIKMLPTFWSLYLGAASEVTETEIQASYQKGFRDGIRYFKKKEAHKRSARSVGTNKIG